MDSKVIYQPCKVDANEWQVLENGLRTDDEGKRVCPVIIGHKCKKNGRNEIIREEPVIEEVYQNVLEGIFTQKGYKVVVRLGREPGLMVIYSNELIFHNDKIQAYVENLLTAIQKVDCNAAVDMLVAGVLNENIEERFPPDSQNFIEKINALCGISHSPEFVIMVLKRYFCMESRYCDLPGERDIQYTDYAGLLHMAGEVLKGKMKGMFDEELQEILLNELLYRFISGNLVEKG